MGETEVPSEADVERSVAWWERERLVLGPPPVWVRWWRANVRPAEPMDLPPGQRLLRDEQGVAVFQVPQEGDRWLTQYGIALVRPVPGPTTAYFGGRRFILAPRRPPMRERLAELLRETVGSTTDNARAWSLTAADRLIERGWADGADDDG